LPGLSCIQSGYPRGRIRVWDTQLGICEPVADVKIRSKNWFKIRNTRTDAQGMFLINTQYANRVKINVIFRNDEVSVRPLRNKLGLNLSLFPINFTIGVYTNMCDANKVDKVFDRGSNRESKNFEAWLACNAVNSRHAQIIFAQQDGILPLKDFRLNVYLSKHGVELFKGPKAELVMANYLFRNRGEVDWIIESAKLVKYVAKQNYVQAGILIITNVLQTQRADIIYNYNAISTTNNGFNSFSSNNVNQQFYAVYTKAGMLKATTNDQDNRWKAYFKRKAKMFDIFSGVGGVGLEMSLNQLLGEAPTPPTLVDFATSIVSVLQFIQLNIAAIERDYIDIVDGFGEYYGHLMCDLYKQYGALSSPIFNNKYELITSTTISSHARVLEDWQPNVDVDLQRQERFGLFMDLHDNTPLENVIPFGFPSLERDDLINNVSRPVMFRAITGWGTSGSVTWTSPQTWAHFNDNVKASYPAQLANLTDLNTAYLLP
jgi:hypothetical protein